MQLLFQKLHFPQQSPLTICVVQPDVMTSVSLNLMKRTAKMNPSAHATPTDRKHWRATATVNVSTNVPVSKYSSKEIWKRQRDIQGTSTLLPPANEVCEGYVFTGVCLSTGEGRAWLPGGHVWLPRGMCGCWQGEHVWLPGACVVDRVCVWLLGAYMVAGEHTWLPGGMHGCQGCMAAVGACVVAMGHVWLLGGMHGCRVHVWLLGAFMAKGGMHGKGGVHGKGGHAWQRGACMVKGRGACVGYNEIQRYNQ